MHIFPRILIGLVLTFAILFNYPSFAIAQTDPTQLAKAVAEIENLDAMRSGLASTLVFIPDLQAALLNSQKGEL